MWTSTEWTALGTLLSGIGTVAGAVAVAVAAKLGSNTFENWRVQKLSERKIEQAERILTATYKARRALGNVRSPMMWAHELNAAETDLEKQDWCADKEKEHKQKIVTAQAYYNRLNAALEERKALDECLPLARALFGATVEKAVDTLNRQFYLVSVAVDMNSEGYEDRELSRKLREDLSSSEGSDRPNKMNGVIEEQVKIIEDSCLPVLTPKSVI